MATNPMNRHERRRKAALTRRAPILKGSKEYFITLSDQGKDRIIMRLAHEDEEGNPIEDYLPLTDDEAHDIQMMINEILFKRNLIDITQEDDT